MSHKDYFGNEIKVGDYVVYSSYGGYSGFSGVFEVEGFTPMKVRVFKVGNPAPFRSHNRTFLYPDTVLVITEQYTKNFPEVLEQPND